MALETEHLTLDPGRLQSGVKRLVEDSSKGFYILAWDGGRIVGQLMITFEWSDWRNGTFWWIQSVYVEPAYRGRSVFKALYRHIENMARTTPDVCGLRLYVEGENHRAQEVYRRLGMTATPYQMFEIDFVMRRT